MNTHWNPESQSADCHPLFLESTYFYIALDLKTIVQFLELRNFKFFFNTD